MSSLVRRLERRALKRMGYARKQLAVVTGPDGTPRIVRLPKAKQVIVAPCGNDTTSTRYPTMIEARYAAKLRMTA